MALELLVEQNGINKSVDIIQEESFNINYSIANIKDISNTNGTFTKTISLPDTPTNREIFGFVTDLSSDLEYNYNSGVSFIYNPNLKVRCWVLEDTVPVLEGYIQVTRYAISDFDGNKVIEATIYADNANFYISMGDKLLEDLDFSEYDFVLSQQNITNSWSNAGDAYTKGYYFPLIDYGHGWTLDDLNDLTIYNLNVKDFLPAVYIKTIWDKIFSTHGYSYVSKFLGPQTGQVSTSYPDPRFGNLIIPYYQQTFQSNTLFNQDKIFHVGLSQSQIPGTYSIGWYQSKSNTGTTYPKAIVNANVSTYPNSEFRRLWYNGQMLSPFKNSASRNSQFNLSDTSYSYDSVIVPFNLTASPMFANGQYDTTNIYYQNNANDVFKQRFILKTDIVTTVSNNWIEQNGFDYYKGTGTGRGFNYIMKVEFFRSIDPTTGLTAAGWATGTGYQIPADLGGASTICTNPSGSVAKLTHWVCDIYGKSNCFTTDGTLIVPIGSNRYLGKKCTNELGNYLLEPTGTGDINFRRNSGDCVSWYYNDGFNQSTSPADRLKGLWVSGYDTICYTSGAEANFHPGYGDWYQQLQLQTIFLDGDETNALYGATGSLLVRGNTPIQAGEKVRCVVTLGGKYAGQQATSITTSYKPPTAAYLLSETNFVSGGSGGVYNYTNANPLTQFYNDVSNDYVTGQKISFNDIIPKNVKQRDFIQDIIKMHNLYVEPDRSDNRFPNRLLIEPRDQYYALATEVLDWRNKLDLNSPITVQVLGETQYKRTRFTYKADNDWYNKQYTQNASEVYGQFIYSLDNEFLVSELTIQSIFSPTPLVQLYSYKSVNGGDILISPGGFTIPVLVSGSNVKPNSNAGPNGSVQTNMRILYKNYIQNQNSDKLIIFSQATNYYPYAGPYDNPYTPTYTVNWGQTLGEFFQTPTDQFFDNLVNTYWASLLTEMGDTDSRIITCQMFLNADDINKFYFYKQVWLTIDGVDGYYKVNSIDGYIPGVNGLCTVTLLKTKSNLPIKLYKGSTSLSGGGTPIVLPSGGGGVIISPPSGTF